MVFMSIILVLKPSHIGNGCVLFEFAQLENNVGDPLFNIFNFHLLTMWLSGPSIWQLECNTRSPRPTLTSVSIDHP